MRIAEKGLLNQKNKTTSNLARLLGKFTCSKLWLNQRVKHLTSKSGFPGLLIDGEDVPEAGAIGGCSSNKNIIKNLCNEILFEKMMMKSFEMMIRWKMDKVWWWWKWWYPRNPVGCLLKNVNEKFEMKIFDEKWIRWMNMMMNPDPPESLFLHFFGGGWKCTCLQDSTASDPLPPAKKTAQSMGGRGEDWWNSQQCNWRNMFFFKDLLC